MNEPSDDVPQEQRVNEVLAAYQRALEEGQAPDRDELLRLHPDLAQQLRAHFDNEKWFAGKTEPLGLAGSRGDGTATTSYRVPKGAGRFFEDHEFPRELEDFGDYTHLEELGRGTFGVVYRARRKDLPIDVALKMLKHASPSDLERFRAEVEILAALDHPNIVSVTSFRHEEGLHYFEMKLIRGGTLRERIRQEGQLSPREAVQLIRVVARAVNMAHQAGILHRDLKPANILLDDQGNPCITDFGLATRLEGPAQEGGLAGTPCYMAPEQARKEKTLTTAVDVWALGVILYELITGKRTFDGESVLATLRLVQKSDPTPPSTWNPAIDRDLDAICLKCLQKDPLQRYCSAAALADDLGRWLEGKPVEARPLNRAEHLWRWVLREPTFAALIALTLLLTVSVAVAILVGYDRTRKALAKSNQNYINAQQNLYNSKLKAARSLRLARGEGYRKDVWDLLQEANKLKEVRHKNPKELRLEAVACMGDFLGLKPEEIVDFPAPVTQVEVYPIGAQVAVGLADGKVKLYANMQGSISWPAHADRPISVLAFAHRGSQPLLVTGDRSGTIKVWNLQTKRLEDTWETSPLLASAAVLPTDHGEELLALSFFDEEAISLYSLESNETIERLPLPGPPREDMALHTGSKLLAAHPRGTLLAAACHTEEDYRLVIFERTGGKPDWKRLCEKVPQLGHIHSLTFSPDGTLLACGCGQGTILYNTSDFSQQLFIPGDISGGLAISPDGRLLALVSWQLGVVRLWGIRTQRELATLRPPAGTVPDQLHSVAFTPKGNFLYTAGSHSLRRWDVKGPREKLILGGHERGGVPGLAFDPSRQRLFSIGKDRKVQVWDADGGTPLRTLQGFQAALQTIAISRGGEGSRGHLLATGDLSGEVWLYDLFPLRAALGSLGASNGLQPTPFSLVLAGGLVPHLLPRKLLSSDPGQEVWSVAFRSDGQYLAGGGMQGLKLWRLAPGPFARLRPRGDPEPISSGFVRHVCFSPDNHWLAWVEIESGKGHHEGRNGKVWLRNLNRPGKPANFSLDKVRLLGSELSLAFRPDSKSIVFVRDDRKIVEWKLPAGPLTTLVDPQKSIVVGYEEDKEVKRFQPAVGPILALHPSKPLLATAARHSVTIWNLDTGILELALPEGQATIWSLAWGADDKLAVGSSDGSLVIWRLKHVWSDLKNLGFR
jgi:WD40 repeat protein/predicted Ser/Thr protein kinase